MGMAAEALQPSPLFCALTIATTFFNAIGHERRFWPHPPTVRFALHCRHAAALPRTAVEGQKRTHAPQQAAPYSITSSTVTRSAGHEQSSSTLYRGVISSRQTPNYN
jgi:hypothetical protein